MSRLFPGAPAPGYTRLNSGVYPRSDPPGPRNSVTGTHPLTSMASSRSSRGTPMWPLYALKLSMKPETYGVPSASIMNEWREPAHASRTGRSTKSGTSWSEPRGASPLPSCAPQ